MISFKGVNHYEFRNGVHAQLTKLKSVSPMSY